MARRSLYCYKKGVLTYWTKQDTYWVSCLGLGDRVLLTPILRSLRSTYPDSYISALVKTEFMEVAECLPYINNAIAHDKRMTFIWEIISQLYRVKYDAIFYIDHM